MNDFENAEPRYVQLRRPALPEYPVGTTLTLKRLELEEWRPIETGHCGHCNRDLVGKFAIIGFEQPDDPDRFETWCRYCVEEYFSKYSTHLRMREAF